MASGQEFVILISIFLVLCSAQNGVKGKKKLAKIYYFVKRIHFLQTWMLKKNVVENKIEKCSCFLFPVMILELNGKSLFFFFLGGHLV